MTDAPHADQGAALEAIVSACIDKLGPLLDRIDLTDPVALAKVVQQVCPELVAAYGDAAGALAAEWYETERADAGVRGKFAPIVADPPQPARWESMATWLTHDKTGAPVVKPDPAALVKGGVARSVRNVHRDTVRISSLADPSAQGWARFGSGNDCGFCLMLISRGGVYTEASAYFASHDNCTCKAGPVWEGERGAQQVEAYRRSARRAAMSESQRKADDKRARAWIRNQ